jgi:hypothetical protein
MSLLLGNAESNHINVEIENRSYPSSNDYRDGNWLNAVVKFHLGAFRGKYDCALRTEEFAAFYEQAITLSQTLSGSAVFKTLEQQIEINLTGNGMGQITVAGVLQDDAGIGNQLKYAFEIDQTYLQALTKELWAIIEKYPVKNIPA